jgi:hypothetical protein
MKKRTNLLFVDLIEDKIKNRGVFITVSLLFYVYLTWAFMVGNLRYDNTPTVIESSLEFAHIAYVGQNISEVRSPQVKITDSSGNPVVGANVTLYVTGVTMDTDRKDRPICDSSYRKGIEGSLEYIRFHDICQVILSGNAETTDSKGNAYFKSFKIERGPEAYYTFQYVTVIDEYTKVESETFRSYIQSKIFQIESLNTITILNPYSKGAPLKVQPEVVVKDFQGNPIKGVRVLAFSWVDPFFAKERDYKNSPSNLKFLTIR